MKSIYEVPQINITVTPANPDTNFWKFYPKSDGFYQLDSLGNETKVGSGSISGLTPNTIPVAFNSSSIVDSYLSQGIGPHGWPAIVLALDAIIMDSTLTNFIKLHD